MRTRTVRISANATVHELTLRAVPMRVFAFLDGAAEPAIRAKLASIGYTEAHIGEGWHLLNGLRQGGPAPVVVTTNDPIGEAVASCETWQSTVLVRVRAMLGLTHPAQADFLFHDFAPSSGAAAVLNIEMFVSRCAELTSGAERKGTRKADHEALRAIEPSGVTEETLEVLAKLVATAQSGLAPEVHEPDMTETERSAQREETLRKMYAWITAWSNMARTVITRRDQLIRLGLAKRRTKKAVVAPQAPAPAPADEETPPNSRAA